MIATMPPRRARVEERKVTVCGKVSPAVAETLEQIAKEMSEKAAPATVTISQLVEHAIKEFIEHHGKARSRPHQR
jgi:hypothetical protein